MKPIKPTKLIFITYIGPSMNPILRSGDELKVIPYDGKKIRRGDVTVFFSPEGDRKITHRVARLDSQGIKTKGDNNKNIDPWILNPDNIIGCVVYAQRGNRRRKVFGGSTGRLFAVTVKAIKVFDSGISFLLRPPYRWMVRIGVFNRLIHRLIATSVLSFNRPEGIELQLLMGGRMIGRWLPGKAQWQIQRPFRLFVDEASLPRGESIHTTSPE